MSATYSEAPFQDAAALAFKALGDPTRREILRLLSDDDMTIGEVVERFDMTRAGVKKHLNLLEDGQLITVTPRGRERLNAINPEGFRAASTWLRFFDKFWDDKLSALKTVIEEDHKNG